MSKNRQPKVDPQALADFDSPMCARGMPGVEMTELRQKVPLHILQVFDAVSLARGKERHVLVIEELEKICQRYLHETIVVQRVLRGNPLLLESDGEVGATSSGARR